MKAYYGVGVKIHILLTSALAGGEWSASRHLSLYPRGKSPRYPLARGLGEEEKILDPTRTRTPTPPSSIPFPVALPTNPDFPSYDCISNCRRISWTLQSNPWKQHVLWVPFTFLCVRDGQEKFRCSAGYIFNKIIDFGHYSSS
jgi:hypothetical protein